MWFMAQSDKVGSMGKTTASDLVSVAIAARLSGRSERHVWRLVASGQLPSAVVAGHRRVRRADLASVGKKPLTEAKQKADINWKCQSSSRDAEIVKTILNELRPLVEKMVTRT